MIEQTEIERSPAPKIGAVRTIFTQDGDDSDATPQTLTVEATDAGGGHFLSLSTERWSIDSPEDLEALLRRVLALVEPEATNG